MLGFSTPENYLSSSTESMTYEHPSYDNARRMLERDFNDDEDYVVTRGSSSRHQSYGGRNRPGDHSISNYSQRNGLGSRSISYGGDRGQRSYGMEARSGGYKGRDKIHHGSALNSLPPSFEQTRTSSSYHLGQSLYPQEDRLDTRDRRSYEERPSSRNNSQYTEDDRDFEDMGDKRNNSSSYSSRDRREIDDGYGNKQYDRDAGMDFVGGFSNKISLSPNSGARDYNGRDRNNLSMSSTRGVDKSADRRFGSTSNDDARTGRQTSKILYDGKADAEEKERRYYETSRSIGDSGEKEFLGKVQRELEDQRRSWKDEIDRLTSSTLMPGSGSSFDAVKNSVVDTTTGRPVFKAFIDVSEFPASSVKVNVDKLTNKVVVEAKQEAGAGATAKSFTQRVQLPRFADDQNLVARMNKNGILKVEVPLIYYFPEADGKNDASKAKSFVYEVRTDPVTGSKVMEILVNTGRDMSSRDLRVEMEGNKLQIWAIKAGSVDSTSPGGEGKRVLIKEYTMPPNADVNAITIQRTKDGRHAILVPLI